MSRQRRYHDAIARLGAAQKSGMGVPPYTRYVNRPLGRRLAAAARLAGLTPNAVTALSMLASCSGLGLLALVPPSAALGLGICVLMVLGYALDSADGQLARLRGGGGPSGEWVDHVSDQARQGTLHAAVLVYLYRFSPGTPPALLLLPLLYGTVSSTRFLSQILAEQMRRQWALAQQTVAPTWAPPMARPSIEETRLSRAKAWLHLPSDPGVLCLTFALAGAPAAFITAYALLCFLNTGAAVASLVRKYGELRTLDGANGESGGRSQPSSIDSPLDGPGTTRTSEPSRPRSRSKRSNPAR